MTMVLSSFTEHPPGDSLESAVIPAAGKEPDLPDKSQAEAVFNCLCKQRVPQCVLPALWSRDKPYAAAAPPLQRTQLSLV